MISANETWKCFKIFLVKCSFFLFLSLEEKYELLYLILIKSSYWLCMEWYGKNKWGGVFTASFLYFDWIYAQASVAKKKKKRSWERSHSLEGKKKILFHQSSSNYSLQEISLSHFIFYLERINHILPWCMVQIKLLTLVGFSIC